MLVTLDELKNSLRIETDEDDDLLTSFLNSSHKLVAQVLRVKSLRGNKPVAKTAVLYAATYMYEHREEADLHELALTLRALLFGARKEVF